MKATFGPDRRCTRGSYTRRLEQHQADATSGERPLLQRYLYRFPKLVECFFNKLKHFQAVATRYEKQDANYRALVKLAAIRIWFRFRSR